MSSQFQDKHKGPCCQCRLSRGADCRPRVRESPATLTGLIRGRRGLRVGLDLKDRSESQQGCCEE